jgi:hypothetical protein
MNCRFGVDQPFEGGARAWLDGSSLMKKVGKWFSYSVQSKRFDFAVLV